MILKDIMVTGTYFKFQKDIDDGIDIMYQIANGGHQIYGDGQLQWTAFNLEGREVVKFVAKWEAVK